MDTHSFPASIASFTRFSRTVYNSYSVPLNSSPSSAPYVSIPDSSCCGSMGLISPVGNVTSSFSSANAFCGITKMDAARNMWSINERGLSCNSSKYSSASFKKLTAIITITMPIGNAATILTDCRLFMELSAKRSAIGSRISRIHHMSWMALCGSSPSTRIASS